MAGKRTDRVWLLCVQAWGVLERQAGNAPLARELFKAALKVGTWFGDNARMKTCLGVQQEGGGALCKTVIVQRGNMYISGTITSKCRQGACCKTHEIHQAVLADLADSSHAPWRPRH
jgi:hypothetical protein